MASGSGSAIADGWLVYSSRRWKAHKQPLEGVVNFDFAVFKRTTIYENMNLEFRTEFFNIFNHPQFGAPNGTVTSSTFGQITNTIAAPGAVWLEAELLSLRTYNLRAGRVLPAHFFCFQVSLPAMRTIPVITCSEAQSAIRLIIEKATETRKAVAIAVADSHGELIAFDRMDGVALPSITVAINKAWTAARVGKPTQEIGEKVKHPEPGHDIADYRDPRFVGWGGGIPVWKNGEVAGAVAVSGLSSTEDASLASLGADLIARS